MVLPQNHFVQNELPQFIFIECSILDIHQAPGLVLRSSSIVARQSSIVVIDERQSAAIDE